MLIKLALNGALFALPVVAAADLTGTAHDFSRSGWNPTGETCVVCHAPDGSAGSVSNLPLWNHEITAASFVPYRSGTLDAVVGQPDGISKLCLSCHDGTVAVDSFGGAIGSIYLSGAARVDSDLSNDHPVSFVYDDLLAFTDGDLRLPSSHTVPQLGGGTIDDTLLFGGKMECSSCHDVHGGSGLGYLLRFSNQSSDLCLTCHDK